MGKSWAKGSKRSSRYVSSAGVMTNNKQSWDDEPASTRMHLGVRILWTVIAGYAVLALAAWWMLEAWTTHLLGSAGAILGALVALRLDRSRRPRPSKDRPHDGWIA